MHLVVKTSVTNPFLAAFFKPPISFVKETRFYSDIIPALETFERERNVPETERLDAFIRCVGFRISLDPSKFLFFHFANYSSMRKKNHISDVKNVADEDAVLLLENIKYQNYINESRYIGFDKETTLAVLKVLQIKHLSCLNHR